MHFKDLSYFQSNAEIASQEQLLIYFGMTAAVITESFCILSSSSQELSLQFSLVLVKEKTSLLRGFVADARIWILSSLSSFQLFQLLARLGKEEEVARGVVSYSHIRSVPANLVSQYSGRIGCSRGGKKMGQTLVQFAGQTSFAVSCFVSLINPVSMGFELKGENINSASGLGNFIQENFKLGFYLVRSKLGLWENPSVEASKTTF